MENPIGTTSAPVLPDWTRTIVSVLNPRWARADHSILVADVLFAELESLGHVPFSATANEDTPQGREFWDKALLGEYGEISDYLAPAPELVRANMPPLAKWRFEAMIDIYGQQNSVNLRGQIDAAVEALPEPNRTIAKSKRLNVVEFYRTDPLFDFIGTVVNMTAEDVDALWNAAAAL